MFSLMRWYKKYSKANGVNGLNGSNGLTDLQRYFYEFMTQGGETGFTGLREIEDYKAEMERMFRGMNRIKAHPKSVAMAFGEGLENANRCIEDAVRFATYMTSRQSGKNVRQSVSDAKRITVNFNRKGSGELGNATFRHLWIFTNPSIQALETILSAGKDHPVRLGVAASVITGMGMAMPLVTQLLWNVFGGGDDDDGWNAVEEYWKLPTWQRRNNYVVWLPFTHKFAMIPLGQELRSLHGFGETLTSALLGHKDIDPALELARQSLELLPLDFTGNDYNLLITLAPTLLQPVMQVRYNTNFTGAPIFKESDYNKYEPAFQKAYVGTPKEFIEFSEFINEMTGGNAHRQGWWERTKLGGYANNPAVVNHLLKGYLGGPYSFVSAIVDNAMALFGGGLPDVREVPVVKRVVTAPRDEVQGGKVRLPDWYYDMAEESRRYQKEWSGYKKDYASKTPGAKEHLMSMTKSEEFKKQMQVNALVNAVNQIRAAQPTVEEPETEADAETKQKLAEGLQQCIEKLDQIRRTGKALPQDEVG